MPIGNSPTWASVKNTKTLVGECLASVPIGAASFVAIAIPSIPLSSLESTTTWSSGSCKILPSTILCTVPSSFSKTSKSFGAIKAMAVGDLSPW